LSLNLLLTCSSLNNWLESTLVLFHHENLSLGNNSEIFVTVAKP